jgi:hypothetical protein
MEDPVERKRAATTPKPPKVRPVPRPFAFDWGGGQIVEEASIETQYTAPAIQLMEYDEGGYTVRFCYYSLDGRFQRSPMMLSKDGIASMRSALKKTPKLRAILRKLVE